jgi:hypothetical protein
VGSQAAAIAKSSHNPSNTPNTGVKCPACWRPVAVLDNLVGDRLLMLCPACSHRWSAPCRREPMKKEGNPRLAQSARSAPSAGPLIVVAVRPA